MNDKELMQQALDALEWAERRYSFAELELLNKPIEALRARLAQLEPKQDRKWQRITNEEILLVRWKRAKDEIIKDVNRYRWLRDRSENVIIDIVSSRTWESVEGYKKQLDDYIDYELEKATPSCLEMAEVITELPQREWQRLTDEEINALDYSGTRVEFVRAIESKLREKNGG